MIIPMVTMAVDGKECPFCKQAKQMINLASLAAKVKVSIRELDLDGPLAQEAVDLSFEHDINEVPAFVIGDRVFVEDRFSLEDIIDAIKSSTSHCRPESG